MAGRIYDRLVAHHGSESIFMDVDNVPYGANFREHIQAVFRSTEVLVAVIGHQWLGHQAQGTSRIHDKNDPVRIEIQTALQEQVLVIPVLIDGAKMPDRNELPSNIRDLAYRNAIHVDSGADFNFHVERLMRLIDQIPEVGAASRTPDDDSISRHMSAGSLAPLRPINHSLSRVWSPQILTYLAALIVMLLAAHYLIVVKFDLNPIYLRLAAFAVPVPFGFLFYRRFRQGPGPASLLGLSAGLVAAGGMLTLVGLVDGVPIVPATVPQWQEALEYVVSIALATVAGNLIGRAVYVVAPQRKRGAH
jgi:hypothetical protein